MWVFIGLLMAKEIGKGNGNGKGKMVFLAHLFIKIMEIRRKGRQKVTSCM